jgi:phospholipid transport system transporter-binding protein
VTGRDPDEAAARNGTVFRRSADGTRWEAEGAITFANAGAVLAAAAALPLPTSGVVACGGITAADSAAVSLLLALKRRAESQGVELAFVHAPAVLTKLASLYGVDDILAA